MSGRHWTSQLHKRTSCLDMHKRIGNTDLSHHDLAAEVASLYASLKAKEHTHRADLVEVSTEYHNHYISCLYHGNCPIAVVLGNDC